MNESTSVYNIFFCHLIFLGYIILSCAKPMNHFFKKNVISSFFAHIMYYSE